METMILVGGTGRSGTSIVKEVLACHSQAASLPFEYRFLIDPDGLVDFYASYTATWSPYLADRRLKRLEALLTSLAQEPWPHRLLSRLVRAWNRDGKRLAPRAYHGWALNHHLPDYERHVRELMERLTDFSFAACWVGTPSYQYHPHLYHAAPKSREELAPILGDFVRAVVGDLLAASGKGFFVEDNTWNILFAREILEILPEARLVHVYRDPRDVVASFGQQRWSPADREQGARWYRDMMTHWFRVRAALPRDSYFEVSLERLVANPEAVLREMCTFASIRFETAMLQVDLGQAHSGRWKSEYGPQDAGVHDILAEVIEALGYEQFESGVERDGP